MNKKKIIPLYAEHIKFLIERCCWKVTKVHQHYTFSQSMFKKEFVIGNQNARQNGKTTMENNFYKLMNNFNFGYDCKNNFDNRFMTSGFDEIEEMSFIRKYQNVFDKDVSDLFSSDHLKEVINEDFNKRVIEITSDDPYRDTKVNSLEIQRKKELDASKPLEKKRVRNHKSCVFKSVGDQVKDFEKCSNTKLVYEFHPSRTASIKAI